MFELHVYVVIKIIFNSTGAAVIELKFQVDLVTEKRSQSPYNWHRLLLCKV